MLSTRELNIYNTIRDYARAHNITPTYSEISAITGYPRSTVWTVVDSLVSKGRLKKEKEKCRSITLVGYVYRKR